MTCRGLGQSENAPAQQIGAITTQTYFDNARLDAAPINPAFGADFDVSGGVDATDLDAWRGAFGNGENGDADGDLDADGQDFLAWQRQVGGGTTPLAAAIPEPEPMELAALAAAATGVIGFRQGRISAPAG